MENAIEISYRALQENPGKNVFLLSQMIHNPEVNHDLEQRGIRFIMDTDGKQRIPWESLTSSDIVIIPAFGTTVEITDKLTSMGIEIQKYNTTCPFVERVWNRAGKLGDERYTVVIHGKPQHEETRATFSHSATNAFSVIVRDMEEAMRLGSFIGAEIDKERFYEEFKGRYSPGFDPEKHLQRVGVVNQTTMLATDTQAIAEFFRKRMVDVYGESNIREHFADTRDTLCYATTDNQESTYSLLDQDADLAVVVGGYNSSNTSHIVELCERKFPTFFINSDSAIRSKDEIEHFLYRQKELKVTRSFIPEKDKVRIILTSGASCPDTMVDRVMLRILSFFDNSKSLDELLLKFGD